MLNYYEQQYSALVAEITAYIGRMQQLRWFELGDYCSKIDALITEAKELLEQMTLEIRELGPLDRQCLTNKVTCYEVELKRLQNDYRIANEIFKQTIASKNSGNQESSQELGDYYDDVTIGNDHRQRLLENSERIEHSSTHLLEGYRVALETEALGTQVLNDLSHQRGILQGARSRLRETAVDLGRSSRTLNTMMLRVLREKAVLFGVGVFLVVTVVICLYLTFVSSEPSN